MTNKKNEQKIEIIYKNNLSEKEQLERIKKVNEIFVDIAANYHIQKKGDQTNE